MSTEQSYDIVLKDLEERYRRCTEEQKMLSEMIANLRRFVASSGSPRLAPPQPTPFRPTVAPTIAAPTAGKFSGMSVRWAILYLLSETSGPLGTSEIAETLSKGGITSNAQRFAGNVSAVLSGMVNQRHEVEQIGSGYQITDQGRAAWEAIRRSPQWASRATPMAS